MEPFLKNWIGLIISYPFIFGVIGVSTVFLRLKWIGPAGARKIVHIGVAHWWLIALFMMNDPIIASIGPASFILLNLISMRLRLFSAMEKGKQEGNWGTIYFPISLLILVNLCFRNVVPIYVGAVGVLVMGWGDGLASAVGGRFAVRKYRIWRSTKSLLGSAVMFAASAVVVLVFSVLFQPDVPWIRTVILMPAATAAVAAGVEALTPWGLDNLSVPLLTTLFYWQVFA